MTDVEVYIWHDAAGKILAVGKPADGMNHRIIPVKIDDTQEVTTVVVPEEILRSLHQTHKIDLRTSRIVPYDRKEAT